jgi:hypothetical protein
MREKIVIIVGLVLLVIIYGYSTKSDIDSVETVNTVNK